MASLLARKFNDEKLFNALRKIILLHEEEKTFQRRRYIVKSPEGTFPKKENF